MFWSISFFVVTQKTRLCCHITSAVSASTHYTVLGIANPLQVTHTAFFTYTDPFGVTDYKREMKAKQSGSAWV